MSRVADSADRDHGPTLDPAPPLETGCQTGGSFATASTHASCQCVAITPPPVTRQPGPKGPAGALTPRPHQCGIPLTSRDESRRGTSGPRPRSEGRPGIVPRNGVTRQPGRQGAGVAMTPPPQQCALSLTSRDESRRGLSGPRPRSDARPRTSARNGVPDGRQLRDSIYARVLPVRCHHAATSDTPTRSEGPGGCADAATTSVRHPIDESG